VTARRTEDGASALWLACDGGHVSTVAALLKHPQVDPDVRPFNPSMAQFAVCLVCICVILLCHTRCSAVSAQATTSAGVRPIECACARNHSEVVDLLLAKGVTSVVDPALWMGLKFAKWMMRRQLPEVLEKQRLLNEQEAAAEAARIAEEERKKEEAAEAKAADKKAKAADKPAADKKKKKKK